MRAPIDREVARGPRRRRAVAVVAVLTALGVAACGSGHSASGNPRTLLRQTFASHNIRSGVLDASIVITPTGSSLVTTPVTLGLTGPFQSRGKGRTPESAFTISYSGLNRHGSFGVRTTASAAYMTLSGTSYQLPASAVAKLHSTLSGSSSGSSAPGLSTFGIDPQNWLSHPTLAGTQTIDGTVTEHVHAAVDVAAFVQSLDRLLSRESSTLGSGAARTISPATARRIAADVRDPTVDVYTGRSDSTLRRLVITATLPVSGTLSTRLGGMTSAALRLTLNYSDLNQPQTIAAPANVHSYAQLQAHLRTLGSELQSGLSSTTGSGAAGSGSSGSGSSSGVSKYSRCISAANGDVAKMQKCAPLLSSGG